jgi:DNA (cytosine-5)-methyltransferase 1
MRSNPMFPNKTPIIDENELYHQAEPWVDAYFERLVKEPKAPVKTVVPDYIRRITVAEAALIQTFPRDYQFQGSQ